MRLKANKNYFSILCKSPLHSYIIIDNNDTWQPYFKDEEVKEIVEALKSSNRFYNPLAEDMLEVMSKSNEKVSKNNLVA